ncbi:MAG: putative metal-binding motif-containing protein [Nanoarchaeota archaeon]|nr:putative metal-binding motif-containing protein [Nanoarchaeota archaeon]
MKRELILGFFVFIFLFMICVLPVSAQTLDDSNNNLDFFENIFGKITGHFIGPDCTDDDKDGYFFEESCSGEQDCDDNDININPGEDEICGNNIDDNCNGQVDENLKIYYKDYDNDHYIVSAVSSLRCDTGNGEWRLMEYSMGEDCDDTLWSVNPSRIELYNNNIDDDCNSSTFDKPITYYEDLDKDNYKNNMVSREFYSAPGEDWIKNSESLGNDCDDTNANVNPGKSEILNNNIDDDCDGQVDESTKTYYKDYDNDNYINELIFEESLNRPQSIQGEGEWLTIIESLGMDCNDTNANVNPSKSEIFNNSIDDDCSTATSDKDFDGDGFEFLPEGIDCNDTNANVNPGVAEICGNNIDDNCNGQVDEDCPIISYNDVELPCELNDKKITKRIYLDNSQPNVNFTQFCDYGNFGFIGEDFSDFSIYINDYAFDKSVNYTKKGISKVELYDKNEIGEVYFDWDFSVSSLDVHNIELVTSKNKNFNYMVVKNLDVSNKSIVLKKKSLSSKVCILDSEVSSVSEFSDDCSGLHEVLVDCPGQNGIYSCKVNDAGSYFLISPLSHSAVREVYESSYCVEDWVCSDWANLACVNNLKTRICFDENGCNTTFNKPNLTQSCTHSGGSVPSCVEDWKCTSWSECDGDEQTRTCKDLYNCGSQEGKPLESQKCEVSKSEISKTFLWVLIIILIISSLFILFIILKSNSKKSEEQNKKPALVNKNLNQNNYSNQRRNFRN